jgi:hypothetical protein
MVGVWIPGRRSKHEMSGIIVGGSWFLKPPSHRQVAFAWAGYLQKSNVARCASLLPSSIQPALIKNSISHPTVQIICGHSA